MQDGEILANFAAIHLSKPNSFDTALAGCLFGHFKARTQSPSGWWASDWFANTTYVGTTLLTPLCDAKLQRGYMALLAPIILYHTPTS